MKYLRRAIALGVGVVALVFAPTSAHASTVGTWTLDGVLTVHNYGSYFSVGFGASGVCNEVGTAPKADPGTCSGGASGYVSGVSCEVWAGTVANSGSLETTIWLGATYPVRYAIQPYFQMNGSVISVSGSATDRYTGATRSMSGTLTAVTTSALDGAYNGCGAGGIGQYKITGNIVFQD